MNMETRNEKINAIRANIRKVLVGKEQLTDLILTAIIAEGHVLLEDVPGSGKTVMAKSLARSIEAVFSRIQFTPDLLPSDVTGLNYYNQKKGRFTFRKGPVFCNILLADEINRATPRTQSALLECMEERQVTMDGVTYPLDKPFFVIATQNPIETSGTFPLPEAQMDRFLMQLSMGFPSVEEECRIMDRFLKSSPLETLGSVCTADELSRLQKDYLEIRIHPVLIDYIARLIQTTRTSGDCLGGVSPRGTLALLRAVRAYAMVQGRSYVVPEDIKSLAIPVLAHRLVFPTGHILNRAAESFLEEILDKTELPTEEWGII